MKDAKTRTGFMPRRFNLSSIPSSYSLNAIPSDSKLELEKIWAEQELKKKQNIVELPKTFETPGKIEKAA